VRNHFLNILGLQPGASEEDIKKAFRKKALSYHPDRNPDEKAQKIFIEICHAYQQLTNDTEDESVSDPSRKKQHEHFERKYRRPISPEEFDQMLKKAEAYAKYKMFKEKNIKKIAYSEIKGTAINKVAVFVGIISLCVGTILSIDYLVLEPRVEEAVMMHYYDNGYHRISTVYDISENADTLEPQFQIEGNFEDEGYHNIPPNELVKVYVTPWLNERVAYSNRLKTYEEANANYKSIYSAFWVFAFLFFFPLVTLVTRGPHSIYFVFVYFNTIIPSVMMVIIALILLL